VPMQEDPGWWPSLRGLWWYAIPVVSYVMRVRARRRETNGLIVLRSVFLGLIAALLLFAVPLSFIAPRDVGDEGWVPWAVVAIGIASLAGIARIRRRPIPTTSPEALARVYRALFFIGVGVASAAALWGFVGVFLGGSLWIYLVGLAFGLVGLWMIAPTRSDIERRQQEIIAAGSPLSLLDALISVPWS
jgi:O-antigen/teichoic acid export membrane protein